MERFQTPLSISSGSGSSGSPTCNVAALSLQGKPDQHQHHGQAARRTPRAHRHHEAKAHKPGIHLAKATHAQCSIRTALTLGYPPANFMTFTCMRSAACGHAGRRVIIRVTQATAADHATTE
jgi:hypothetical protein